MKVGTHRVRPFFVDLQIWLFVDLEKSVKQ